MIYVLFVLHFVRNSVDLIDVGSEVTQICKEVMWAVYTSIILSKLCNQSVICEELTKCSQGCIEIGRYDSAVQTCTLVCELWDL